MKPIRLAAITVATFALSACTHASAPTPTATTTTPATAAATATPAAAAATGETANAQPSASAAAAATAAAPAKAESNILGLKRPQYDKTNKNWKFGVMDPGTARFDAKKDYFATIHTTLGDITVKFYPEVAPHHVTSFINLSELGYYDDAPFHRIIPGFMMQGGDPTGQGNAGPNYKMKAEFNPRKHVRGTLAAARTADPNSAGSQFYICFKPAPFLDNQYTVFGEVTSGMDVVDKFEAIGSASGHPSRLEKITSVDVFTKDKGGKT